METVLVISGVALHSAISSVFLFDLITVSQRTNKFNWAILLLFLPLVSAFLYTRTRKRNRPHNGKITRHKVLAREQHHEYEQMSA